MVRACGRCKLVMSERGAENVSEMSGQKRGCSCRCCAGFGMGRKNCHSSGNAQAASSCHVRCTRSMETATLEALPFLASLSPWHRRLTPGPSSFPSRHDVGMIGLSLCFLLEGPYIPLPRAFFLPPSSSKFSFASRRFFNVTLRTFSVVVT